MRIVVGYNSNNHHNYHASGFEEDVTKQVQQFEAKKFNKAI